MREIKRIEGIIEQQKRWNRERNIKTAESKQKQIDRIVKDLVKPESENHKISIQFPVKSQSGSTVLTVNNDSKAFGDVTLYKNASFTIERGQRACLIGPNGVGKSTLIKRLVGGENPAAFMRGVGVTLGYFDQFQEQLNPKNTPFSEIQNTYPFMGDTAVRNALAAFEFKGDDVFKINESLSGGERARVSLLKLVLSGNNFLVLDEPTNHLDVESIEWLEGFLQSYKGSFIIISHDRYFLDRVVRRIFAFEGEGKIVQYEGGYTDYMQKRPEKTDEIKNNWIF